MSVLHDQATNPLPLAHPGAGIAFGKLPPDTWAANLHWLLAAMVAGVPLGRVGAFKGLDLHG
nr:hypothetical protein Ade03nite_09970 [Actinoplanes derwentensis]